MAQTYSDSVLGTITLNESYRAKSISIKISKRDNSIILTYPCGGDKNKAIGFLESKRERILLSIERNKARIPTMTSLSDQDIQALIDKAYKILPQRIEKISRETNLKYTSLRISAARSRWGSCSSVGGISLSVHLAALPLHLIDFVIIHELCHTVHHNHSPKFHALVNHVTSGREKELEKELKNYRINI